MYEARAVIKGHNLLYLLTTASCCTEDGCLGYPGASTVTSGPLDSIMSREPLCSLPGTCHTGLPVEMGRGRGWGKTLTNRPKMFRKLLNPKTKTYWGLPRWNTLVQWRSALSLQYHTKTADQKYQLLFVVDFVNLHLTTFMAEYTSQAFDVMGELACS